MSYDFSSCKLCPRACGADRQSGRGLCGVGASLRVARAAPHFWEEPCISGARGSGTIFFSGCPLRCVYCQNRDISFSGQGKDVSPERLREICFELKAAGVHNINLVTPMHFAPQIRAALLPIKKDIALPIVVNTGGYDSPEQIALFEGLADIYLPDFKYLSTQTASFSRAPDYPAVAEKALRLMVDQIGKPRFDANGMLVRGVLVRHLILPGCRKESRALLARLAELFQKDEILLSVMSQFTPQPGALPPLDRRITTFEQQSVCDFAASLGFDGYFQARSSAKEEYTPAFDLTGVLYPPNK